MDEDHAGNYSEEAPTRGIPRRRSSSIVQRPETSEHQPQRSCCSWSSIGTAILGMIFPPYGYILLMRRTCCRAGPGTLIACSLPLLYMFMFGSLAVIGMAILFFTNANILSGMATALRVIEVEITGFVAEQVTRPYFGSERCWRALARYRRRVMCYSTAIPLP